MNFIRNDFYLEILGIFIAFIITVIIGLFISNYVFIFSFWFISTIVSIFISHHLAVKLREYFTKIIKDNNKEKIKSINDSDDLSDNLKEIIRIDSEISNIIIDLKGKKFNKEWERLDEKYSKIIKSLFSKMDNGDLVLVLNFCNYVYNIVDIYEYFTKLEPDYKYMKEHPNELIKYYYDVIDDEISLSSLCDSDEEFLRIREINDYDNIEKYILENMSNEELMKLAEKENNMDIKMYFYSFLKKDK